MNLTMTPEQLHILDEKFAQLKDNRSFEQYMADVIEHTKKQKPLCEGFIVTLAINGVEVNKLKDTSCENNSDMDFHFDVALVTTEPDYEACIEGVSTSMEFKGTNKNITHILIKKYDVDKYAEKERCIIIHVVDTDGTHPKFTILTPQEVQRWQVAEDDVYFGKKLVYIDVVTNHKYFTMKILNSELKDFIKSKVNRGA